MEQQQAQNQAQRREAMPEVAAFIDLCRAAYGAELVNQQMAVAVKAQREQARVLAEQGAAAAARWLKANAHRCTFFASEAGHTAGLALPTPGTPPIGTPSPETRPGNSSPAGALVRGFYKSEHCGVRGGAK